MELQMTGAGYFKRMFIEAYQIDSKKGTAVD